MHVQTQPTSYLLFDSAINHKVLWAGLVTGLTALSFIGGATFMLSTAAEDREAKHTPPSIEWVKSDTTVPKEAYFLDQSVVNRENLPDEPNPGPMAIAAYE
jgi:hypothetical protein